MYTFNYQLDAVINKKDVRPQTHQVYLDGPNRCMYATNGHIAACIPAALDGEEIVHDLKSIDDYYPATISGDHYKYMRTHTNGPMATRTIDFPRTCHTKESASFLPTVRMVLMEGDALQPYHSVALDPQQLLNLAKAITNKDDRKTKYYVVLRLPRDPASMIKVEPYNPQNDAWGVLMPVKLL